MVSCRNVIDARLRGDKRLAKVWSWAKSNPSKRCTLQVAASAAGLERTYFSRYFQDVTGMAFRSWERSLRIDRAKVLLLTPLKISDVALAVGYSDVTTLERNFRRCEGMSPREWRALRTRHSKTQHLPIESQ
jgi:AraC-like DNA-binding protein